MGRDLRDSIAPTILAYSLLVLCIGILLGPALSGRDRLAFRDVSHFYTPLYEYVAARQSEHWLPLWNPLDLTGMPLAGETTTAMFYPVRFLVYAVVESPKTAMTWYIVIHLLIAAMAIHFAARSVGAGSLGCAIAILTYPLAGPILFLIYNPPFLVGAAWMPIAIAGGLRLRMQRGRLVWIAITAIALALPILGGDPQSTIHVLLIGAVMWLIDLLKNGRRNWHVSASEFGRLLAAFAIGGCISAPQLAASIDWTIQSNRMDDFAAALDRYDFSVQPWHWLELIVPEVSGRMFPTYERLSNAIPGDGRSWTMTLYAGIIPLVLVIHRFVTHRIQRLDLWDCLTPVGLVLAVSGPYWLFAKLVPGYDSFRYPAKWLPLVPLGMAVVAARQADQFFEGRRKNVLSICLMVSMATIAVALISVLVSSFGAIELLESLELTDRFWGPLQPERAFNSIVWSSIVSTLVICGLWGLVRTQKLVSSKSHNATAFALAVVCLVACDLLLATRHQIATINVAEENSVLHQPQPQLQQRSPGILRRKDTVDAGEPLGRAMRTTSDPAWPNQWLDRHDGSKRLLEVEASQRATRFGRWHLANQEAVFNSVTSIRPQRIDAFWMALANIHGRDTHSAGRLSWSAIESWLGINHQWATQLPDKESVANAEFIVTSVEKRLSSKLAPMYQWDTTWRPILKRPCVSNAEIEKRLRELIDETGKLSPLVEFDAGSLNEKTGSMPSTEMSAPIWAETDQWIFHVETSDAGLLTVKTYQDGNWHASLRSLDRTESISTNSQTLRGPNSHALRVDYLFMGIEVPPGKWEIKFQYQPWWLVPSLLLSVCGTSISLILLISGGIKRKVAAATPTTSN